VIPETRPHCPQTLVIKTTSEAAFMLNFRQLDAVSPCIPKRSINCNSSRSLPSLAESDDRSVSCMVFAGGGENERKLGVIVEWRFTPSKAVLTVGN
jgi:hypothetical protein